MISFDLLHVVLFVVAAAGLALAAWRWQAAQPELARLEAELSRERLERQKEADSAAARYLAMTAERDDLRMRADRAERALDASGAAAQERELAWARERESLAALRKEVEEKFQALADDALRRSQAQFLQVADETFKKHKEVATGDLALLMAPVHETFGLFRQKVEAIEKVRAEDRAAMSEQLRQVGDAMAQTQTVASRLATALAAPRGGGRWGEETLRNVLEMAGLSAYADFTEQTESATDQGKIRPDVIIRMPGGRQLVIDSKVSLDDYLAASEATDAAQRKARLASHASRVRAHVTRLSRKDYWNGVSGAVDFVAMFIPGENFYAAVLEFDRDIFDFAARNNVVIVTPSTLIALAKSVAYGWRQEQAAENAEQAAALGRELYQRLAKMSEHLGKVGGALTSATRAYNDLVGSYESRVLPSARRFDDLQLGGSGKTVDAVARVELAPRLPAPQDLFSETGPAEPDSPPRRRAAAT